MSKVGDIIKSLSENHPDREKRLAICRRCPFSERWFGKVTCGTPLVGCTVPYLGEFIELCGCVMSRKTKLLNADCPAKKW